MDFCSLCLQRPEGCAGKSYSYLSGFLLEILQVTCCTTQCSQILPAQQHFQDHKEFCWQRDSPARNLDIFMFGSSFAGVLACPWAILMLALGASGLGFFLFNEAFVFYFWAVHRDTHTGVIQGIVWSCYFSDDLVFPMLHENNTVTQNVSVFCPNMLHGA